MPRFHPRNQDRAAPRHGAVRLPSGKPVCQFQPMLVNRASQEYGMCTCRRFDALAGYLSALLPDGSNGSCSALDAAAAAGWPATHVIGKDILRFHAVRGACFTDSAAS